MSHVNCDKCKHSDFHHPGTGCTAWDKGEKDFCGCDSFTVNCRTCGHSHSAHRSKRDPEAESATRCSVVVERAGKVLFCNCEEFTA